MGSGPETGGADAVSLTLPGRLGHRRGGLGDDNGGGHDGLDRAGRGVRGGVGVARASMRLGDGAHSGISHYNHRGDRLAGLVPPLGNSPLTPGGDVGSQRRGGEGEQRQCGSHGVCAAGRVDDNDCRLLERRLNRWACGWSLGGTRQVGSESRKGTLASEVVGRR